LRRLFNYSRVWLALMGFTGLISAWPSCAQPNSSTSDDAYITFYSPPVTLLGGLPRHDLGACKCRIFDGDKQLAFMGPARFITFRIAAGAHVFSAVPWMYKQSNHGAHMDVDAEPGQHYFVECGTPAFGPTFVIREVVCAVARDIGQRTKPLEPAHLRPDGRPILVTETSFPQCQ
jgi:hypothetical protein